MRLRLLGAFALSREGRAVPPPASRKVRALLAYLALAPRPTSRDRLCELLWDAADDPRGQLRWTLSRLRRMVDEPGSPRILTREGTIELDLAGCEVDALEVSAAMRTGIGALDPGCQRQLADRFEGEFLEGLEIDGCAGFAAWLAGQRRRFREVHAALLEQLATRLPAAEAFQFLERWLQLAPFDRRVHETLLAAFASEGRIRDGEEHLAATAARLESEGQDCAPLHQAWRTARWGHGPVPPARLAARRASIAVMPFSDESATPGARSGIADALAHDVTTRLARLRCLFVIAQGSTSALHERRIGAVAAGRMLGVDYVLGGAVRRLGSRLTIAAELAETRAARVVWSDVLDRKPDDAFLVIEELGNRIVAAIAGEIETLERHRAIQRPPDSLDAWEAHHRGLWHMYRFTCDDNARARHFFETAVRLDPTFARAHAGLSFTHFQDAFQGWSGRGAASDRAFAAAGQSLMADDRDPAAHWALGRALWLRGADAEAVTELEQAIELSPSFALAHYSLAFVQAQSGDATAAIARADCSRALSPFDPLLFGMLGARALALARLGRYEEAATWAVRAAARPNAHPHIFAMAAYCLALAGALAPARMHAATVHRALPGYGIDDFLNTFHLDGDGAAAFRRGAARIGVA